MDKVEYDNKANEIFIDMEAYALFAEDRTKKHAAAIKKKVNELARLKVVRPDDSKLMTLSDLTIAHAYGLPKVHKVDVPLRIIVPLIRSPTYNIAKWLYSRLKRLTYGSDYSINNSQAFHCRVQGLKGIRFSHTDAAPTDFLANLESLLLTSDVPDDMCADIRSCATGLLRQRKHHQTLPTEEKKALRSLKTDDKIVIVSADKGGATFIMDKVDYVNKANQIFDDREAYAPLAADPTKKQAATIKKKVNELARLKLISPDDSRSMTLNDPRIAPIDSVARCLEQSPIGIPTAHVLDMLKLCLKNYCLFDGKFYKQVKGTPMGSPISGLLAELVLQRLEQDVVHTFEPKMWLRYVDDTFVIIKTREVERLHQSLNSVFPAIQFTREEATGDTLPFLDVSIQRLSDGKLATSVHRKESSAEIILKYGSNHPAAHKRNSVRTLFHRAHRTCNSDDALKKELAYLHRLFRSNGYPASFAKNCLRRQRQLPNPESHEDRASQKFYSLPYIQGISEALSRQLKLFGIYIAHKPASSLRETSCRVKDPVHKEHLSSVIYRILCANCPCVYIGHTGRCLGTRINEHKLALRRRDPLSLVFAHAIEHDHRFNWDGTEVIAKANTRQAREFLEAWHSGTTSINRHVDLDAHYEGLRTRSLSCSQT
nr:unnamed protein product [Spirometra erinaceieuropaei]